MKKIIIKPQDHVLYRYGKQSKTGITNCAKELSKMLYGHNNSLFREIKRNIMSIFDKPNDGLKNPKA